MEYFKEEEKLLLLEGALASSTLAGGLECLRKADIYQKGMYYQAFLSLATGMERLLKLIIIYEYKINNNDRFPDNKYLKEKGHNLYEMFKAVLPQVLEDELYNTIIKFLSSFAMTTRYYNLDVLTGREVKLLNPLEEWNNIELVILEKYNVRTKSLQNKDMLANILNQNSSVLYLDTNMRQIDNFTGIINEIETREDKQGYSVLLFFKIIKSLVYKLTRLEIDNNLFPCLREFFDHFRGNYTDSEIRRKKNWSSTTF